MMSERPPDHPAVQRPLARFIVRHQFLAALAIGVVLMAAWIGVLTATDGFHADTTPTPSVSCQNYETLIAAWNGPTGDPTVDDIAERNIAQAKKDCDAGR